MFNFNLFTMENLQISDKLISQIEIWSSSNNIVESLMFRNRAIINIIYTESKYSMNNLYINLTLCIDICDQIGNILFLTVECCWRYLVNLNLINNKIDIYSGSYFF